MVFPAHSPIYLALQLGPQARVNGEHVLGNEGFRDDLERSAKGNFAAYGLAVSRSACASPVAEEPGTAPPQRAIESFDGPRRCFGADILE
jgi:hypothetical protein